MEIAIDTSTRFASIGLSSQGECFSELTWRSDRNHSVELIPNIQRVLDGVGRSVSHIEAIYVASGPGGFSALRVGMSAAKAMAVSLDVPLIAVGTLDVEAQPYVGLGRPVCALIGAGRRRLYFGSFGESSEPTYGVVEHSDLGSETAPDAIYCGEGVAQVRDLIRDTFGGETKIADMTPPTRRASVLGSLGYRMLKEGRVADSMTLEPIYLRSSQVNTANRTWQNR